MRKLSLIITSVGIIFSLIAVLGLFAQIRLQSIYSEVGAQSPNGYLSALIFLLFSISQVVYGYYLRMKVRSNLNKKQKIALWIYLILDIFIILNSVLGFMKLQALSNYLNTNQ